MDNQNQTNQPTNSGFPPIVPSVPEDITPSDTPVTTTTTTTVTSPQPVSVPEVAPLPPVEVSPATPFPTPVAQPMMPPIPAADPFVMPTAAPIEPEMPANKPKSKLMPIIGGVAALLLIVGVAGAAYYVSNQLSARQAVAPTAPESEPLASECRDCSESEKGNGACTKPDGSPGYYCIPISGGGGGGDTGGGGTSSCDSTNVTHPACRGKSVGDEVCYTNPNNNYSSSLICQRTTGTLCSAENGGNACGSGGGGGGGTTACVRGGTPACYVSAPSPDVCTQTGFKFACGWECCSDSGSICCCQGCYPAGTDCSLHACKPTATCDETKRDTPKTKEITFAKSGSVIPFMRNPGYSGTITLSKTGSTAISIPFSGNGAAQELTPFTVTAGDVYTIKVVITSDAGESYGWIPNKSANICGPVKAPGASLDSNNKATGFCGSEVDITALKTLAAKTDMTGITAGGSNASVQCWADAMLGDATQDYDFEDYTIAFGYAQSSVGSCSKINIYKKVGTTFSPTALTVAELQKLTVGDVLMLYSRSNNENLKGRFKISIDGVEGEWIDGTIDGSDKTVHSYSYTIAKAGTYKFEAQVTTVP